MIRKLLNAYWIVAALALVLTIAGDVNYFYFQSDEYSSNSAWTMILMLGSRWNSAAQFLAFGIACECLYVIGETIGDIARSKEPPQNRLY